MVISSSTFVSDIILFIRDLLRANLTDPISGRTDGFVMTAFPKTNTKYPIVVVRLINANTTKMGMQSEIQWMPVNLEIQLWARNSKESDEICQDIINILRKNEFGTNSTNVEDIHDFKITSITPLVETDGDNTIHRKVIQARYTVILA